MELRVTIVEHFYLIACISRENSLRW